MAVGRRFSQEQFQPSQQKHFCSTACIFSHSSLKSPPFVFAAVTETFSFQLPLSFSAERGHLELINITAYGDHSWANVGQEAEEGRKSI